MERRETPPRYAPDLPLPPYAFVGPHWPHPRTHPEGHSYGLPERRPAPLDPAAWEACPLYLHGIDLLNRGYYWEAHEAWEDLWNACAPGDPTAEHLKGLIKLAAAGVKVRQGIPRGIRSHCERAAAHLDAVRRATGRDTFAGVRIDALAAQARAKAREAERLRGDPAGPPEPALGLTITVRPRAARGTGGKG